MSTSNDIKRGDVVRLASGGQEMTVGEAPSGLDSSVDCYWFRDQGAQEKRGDFETARIPIGALVKADSIETF